MNIVKKDIICTETPNLPRQDLITIMKILKKHAPEKIKTFPDGSRIDLGTLSPEIIDSVYNVIKYKLRLKE